MNICDLKINRSGNVLGVSPSGFMLSFKAQRGESFSLSLFSERGTEFSDKLTLDDCVAYYPPVTLPAGQSCSVRVENEYGDAGELCFRTAEVLDSPWLISEKPFPIFRRVFDEPEGASAAWLTVTALGLYTVFLNGRRVGDRFLAPGMNDYDDYVRYQTYALTDLQPTGNLLEVFVGKGWFSGRFGIDGHGPETWGKDSFLRAKITFDGASDVIVTDGSWEVSDGYVTDGGIYDGETRNDTRVLSFTPARVGDAPWKTQPDETSPITAYEERKGVLLTTPRGETVIDFGQNSAGVVRFVNRLPHGQTLRLQFGEILQDGCFYRDNLRSAKAEYNYVSDGVEKEVMPLFTFYGFRYMKVECEGEISADDFTAVYLSTEMASTVSMTTDHGKLNRLLSNVRYGQRSNFIDVPTDCPQRDERLGWTADTQVFTPTACCNSEAYSFYKKFMRDMIYDQEVYYDGDFPMYSPSLKGSTGAGGAVWADAGVFVPWELYLAYGDKTLLASHYPHVKRYIDKLIDGDKARGDGHLLTQPFTFGDWLAQDGLCPQSLKGGTDDVFIRSAYYCETVRILSSMAEILGYPEKARYAALTEEIRAAILHEFFTPAGRLALDTQAAYVLALRFGLYPQHDKLIAGFKDRLRRDIFRIKCGFVGAPLMVKTMFDHGMEEEAMRVLFNEGYPGWFHEINLGATTVWERWNSVDADGHITGIFMNSLNHYAYGSVAEAVYKYIGGLSATAPAWRSARIAPKLSHHVKSSSITFDSPYGVYGCDWEVKGSQVSLTAAVPHGCTAEILLPESGKEPVTVGEGRHVFTYEAARDLSHPFSEFTRMCDLLTSSEAAEILRETLPATYAMVTGENEEYLVLSVFDMQWLPMYGVTPDGYAAFQTKIHALEV